jgi:hypothetical protein
VGGGVSNANLRIRRVTDGPEGAFAVTVHETEEKWTLTVAVQPDSDRVFWIFSGDDLAREEGSGLAWKNGRLLDVPGTVLGAERFHQILSVLGARCSTIEQELRAASDDRSS